MNTLPNSSKVKRHKELDCHNVEFEKFLKSRYLIILDKKKSSNDLGKGSRRCLKKMYTEGNITGSNVHHPFRSETNQKINSMRKKTGRRSESFDR